SVPGQFTFTNPALEPPLGTSQQSILFTPQDTATYQTVSGSVSVTVQPAAIGATGAVFMFNFGGLAYSGNESPAHASGSVPADNTTWRTVNDANVTKTIQLGSWT
ncbi:hypothetical protein RZS08_47575, partial [Arthrospira platensis SPKY1]|nr:hypothetical protein [Arthrospira platensis SPKY1]